MKHQLTWFAVQRIKKKHTHTETDFSIPINVFIDLRFIL